MVEVSAPPRQVSIRSIIRATSIQRFIPSAYRGGCTNPPAHAPAPRADLARQQPGRTESIAIPHAAEIIDLFRRFYGPTMNAFDAAEKNGKAEELHQQLLDLAKAQNMSQDGSTSIPATFLRVTINL
jgi:hypothetical protein